MSVIKASWPLLCGLAGLASALSAQTILDPSAQLLITSLQQGAATRSVADGQAANATASVFVTYDEETIDWSDVQFLGGHVGVANDGLATVRIPLQQLEALASVPGITYIQASQQAHTQLDLARQDTHADQAIALPSPLTGTPYTGRGVIIGWVDAGIDYRHNAFHTADHTLRIKRVWEQDTDAATASIPGLSAPGRFGYGAEFTTADVIHEAGADRADVSHGTHVGGIAAGSDTWMDGQYHGVAPDADLVAVTFTDSGTDNVSISDAIQYIFDYADAVGQPCVINLSLGGHQGPHDGTSPFDQLIDRLQGPGRLIVAASSNYGADKFHLTRQFSLQAEASDSPFASLPDHPLQTLLNIQSSNPGIIDVWAETSLRFRMDILSYNTFSHAEKVLGSLSLPADMASDSSVKDVQLSPYATGQLRMAAEVNPFNQKTHITLNTQIKQLRTNMLLMLRFTPLDGSEGQLDVWADDSSVDFNATDASYKPYPGMDYPTAESTITEIGGTSRRILTVGAYVTRDVFSIEGDDTQHPVGQFLHHLFDASGYGPTVDGRQKPEVCAPGSFLISSVSGYDNTFSYTANHYVDASGHMQRYGYLQGTSMSTPFVTGAVALWLQAYPHLSPEQLKQIIAESSRLDDFTTDPRYWGSGKIDVLKGLKSSIALAQEDAIQSLNRDATDGAQLYDLGGHLLRSSSTDAIGVPTSILWQDIPPGIYLLRIGQRCSRIVL